MAAKTTKKKSVTKSAKGAVRVRMYRSGLGDCFLLTFPGKQGKPFHMLIDCGVFFQTPHEKQRMIDIANDISAVTSGTIDVLVATHEHYDHLIGFKHAKSTFAAMTIKEVWLSWIEKPGEPRAAWLRAIEDKLKAGLQLALQAAKKDTALAARATRLQNVLQFIGNPVAKNKYSEQLGEVKRWLRDDLTTSVKYLEPHSEPIELVPGVRVYPLGPPLKESLFRHMNDSQQAPETYHTPFAFSAVPAFAMLTGAPSQSGLATESDLSALAQPFEKRWRILHSDAENWRVPMREDQLAEKTERELFFKENYGFDDEPNAWRRIDNDWLSEAENLAIQLDSLTNNSSLALAIEIGATRRVILMAADAQVGNWLSWHEGTWKTTLDSGSTVHVKAEDLLRRTILYKVGHHGSHNATLKQKGLEMMSDELVAMIPVNQDFANNVKGWQMPFPGLLTELTKKTKGRVIRADHGLPKEADVSADVRAKFKSASAQDTLYCDYFVPI